MTVMPRERYEWTVDDLEQLPEDDGLQYELLDGARNITAPLALAVEILSPSTRRKDLVLKRSKYEDCGVASYWVIDPDGPSITAWDLVDGAYVEAGRTIGEQTVELSLPFPVTITPASLR